MLNYMNHISKARAQTSGFRARRLSAYVLPLITKVINERGHCSVLDVGGVESYWRCVDFDDRITITLANLDSGLVAEPRRFKFVTADARNLSQFRDNSFDIVHSNSVIEHVGRWRDMKDMAGEVRRLAPIFYVQTPNFWFPIDPHTRVPLIHLAPINLRYRLHCKFSLGWYSRAGTFDEAMGFAEDAVMLDWGQMGELFPDAVLHRERVMGLTKSIIAIREH